MTPTEKLQSWLKMADAATEGPWKTTRCHTSDCWCLCVGIDNGNPDDEDKVSAYANLCVVDATFIAESRTAVPALCRLMLKAIERLEEISDPECNAFKAGCRAREFLAEVERELK